jgi:hypothetical protein
MVIKQGHSVTARLLTPFTSAALQQPCRISDVHIPKKSLPLTDKQYVVPLNLKGIINSCSYILFL